MIRMPLSRFKVPLVSAPQTLLRPDGRNTWVTRILQDHMETPPRMKTVIGFRAFCAGKDLSAKKCVPCNSNELRPMTEQAAHHLISQVPEWDLVNEGGKLRLSRSWKVKTFLKGLDFFQAVANVAEAEVLRKSSQIQVITQIFILLDGTISKLRYGHMLLVDLQRMISSLLLRSMGSSFMISFVEVDQKYARAQMSISMTSVVTSVWVIS